MAIVGLFVRVFILKHDNAFPVSTYLFKVMLPLIPVAGLSLVIPVLIYKYTETTFLVFLFNSFIGFISSIVVIWIFGLDKVEKSFITEKINSRVHYK